MNVNELKTMGEAGAREINRRYEIVFPYGIEQGLSCKAAALELYASQAYIRLRSALL